MFIFLGIDKHIHLDLCKLTSMCFVGLCVIKVTRQKD